MSLIINDNLVLLGGMSSTGKSASLKDIKNPKGVFYANCESGKRLPFKSEFQEFVITDPLQIIELFTVAESRDDVHTIVIDSLTYLMDMYESIYVYNSTNTMKGWADYAQYFKSLMQNQVAKSTKHVVFTAHVNTELNEGDMVMETFVPVKGALKRIGLESYFSCIIGSKKVPIKKLDDYKSDLLTITPLEESLGFKYVYQTQLTKETVNERLRGPIGLWAVNETYIDNNLQLVMDRLVSYYS